ncbi:hypothetical protein MMSR116_02195 [Methylobacterium mesophilicum SR1.6/6]|uniref:Uncharacterized protein n=1 Tax=Methylobacterium mesophilicum SR1.6/6 TaxID=908290 RepID=A0A6B9FFJ7_9HYPH|nr:hypothetical protein [Methylobacterium mesophilicum]QGY00846.1 hypothetical protein MMSR116_02195 [Methylobacterium mesophilicum SR1.6/6]
MRRWTILLAATGILLPGATLARERAEQPAVDQAMRGGDAELITAQEAVRRAQEKVRSKQRVGGRELSQAQEEMVQAKEQLRVVTTQVENRRSDTERQQWSEKMRRDKEAADARDAEQARQQQDEARRLAEETRLNKERQDAERQRQADSWHDRLQKLDERNQRQAAAEAAERQRQRQELQREQAKPQNVLMRLYASYIEVKRCHDSLAGKAFVYVDDRDLATAREQTKFVEGKLLIADPAIDRDAAWRSANEKDPGRWLFMGGQLDVEAGKLTEDGQEFCRGMLAAVKEQYLRLNPDAAIVKKDF